MAEIIYFGTNGCSGHINWDSKAAAFCFGQDFLVHYHSEDMVVVGNKFDK